MLTIEKDLWLLRIEWNKWLTACTGIHLTSIAIPLEFLWNNVGDGWNVELSPFEIN